MRRRYFESDDQLDREEKVAEAIDKFELEFDVNLSPSHYQDITPYSYSQYHKISRPGHFGIFGLGAEVGFAYDETREDLIEVWIELTIDGTPFATITTYYLLRDGEFTRFDVET